MLYATTIDKSLQQSISAKAIDSASPFMLPSQYKTCPPSLSSSYSIKKPIRIISPAFTSMFCTITASVIKLSLTTSETKGGIASLESTVSLVWAREKGYLELRLADKINNPVEREVFNTSREGVQKHRVQWLEHRFLAPSPAGEGGGSYVAL
jgi:hypothetical protein